MADDPTANTNRTIQVDALSDVELLDSSEGAADGEVAPPVARGSALPPPLPHRRPSVIALVVVIAIAGVLGAAGSYLIPSATPAAVPPPPAPSEAAAAPAATPTEEASGEVVRHVPLDESFVIRLDEDAGLPPTE